MLWESSLCCFHIGFLLSLLPFPVPEELIYSSTHNNTSQNSVYFPSQSAKYRFLNFGCEYYFCLNSYVTTDDSQCLCQTVSQHYVPLCIQYVKFDLCLVKHNEPPTTPLLFFCFPSFFFLSCCTFLPLQGLSANLLSLSSFSSLLFSGGGGGGAVQLGMLPARRVLTFLWVFADFISFIIGRLPPWKSHQDKTGPSRRGRAAWGCRVCMCMRLYGVDIPQDKRLNLSMVASTQIARGA